MKKLMWLVLAIGIHLPAVESNAEARNPHLKILKSRPWIVPQPVPKTRAELANFINGFRTCKINWRLCDGNFDCTNYTHCFCKEFYNKVGGSTKGYCDSIGYNCYKDGKVVNRGHAIAIVGLGATSHAFSKRFCLVEPQNNTILNCWDQKQAGLKVSEGPNLLKSSVDLPRETQIVLSRHLGVRKDCQRKRGKVIFRARDWDHTQTDDWCCLCRRGDQYRASDVRLGHSFSCRHACWNANAMYVRRIFCDGFD